MAWISATVIGTALGSLLPDPKALGLILLWWLCLLGFCSPVSRNATDRKTKTMLMVLLAVAVSFFLLLFLFRNR